MEYSECSETMLFTPEAIMTYFNTEMSKYMKYVVLNVASV